MMKSYKTKQGAIPLIVAIYALFLMFYLNN